MQQVLTIADALVFDACPIRSNAGQMAAEDAARGDEGPTAARRAEWMEAAQSGDRHAYEQVLADSVALTRAVARRLGVPHDQLDDVVQETLITIHRVRHTYDPAQSYDAWLSAIARHRSLDALRSHGRRGRREVHDEALLDSRPALADASAEVEYAQRARRLRAAVDELPPGQREAVEHMGLRGHTLGEAANLTGRSPGALKVNLHRAVKALRARLNGKD